MYTNNYTYGAYGRNRLHSYSSLYNTPNNRYYDLQLPNIRPQRFQSIDNPSSYNQIMNGNSLSQSYSQNNPQELKSQFQPQPNHYSFLPKRFIKLRSDDVDHGTDITYFHQRPTESRYKDAYNHCSLAQSQIKTRINKLKKEKDEALTMKSIHIPHSNDMSSLYNMKSLSNAKGQLANPNLYSYQFMDPIYYPLEMPLNGEPVALPNIEIGAPLASSNCGGGGGLGISELLMLMTAIGKVKAKPVQIKAKQEPKAVKEEVSKPKTSIEEEEEIETKSKVPVSDKRKAIIPGNKRNESLPNRGIKRNWWKLARDFVNLYIFFSVANKYTKFSKVRNSLIGEKTLTFQSNIEILKDWIIAVMEPVFEELKVFQDLDITFKNFDSKIKIQANSQKIIAIIKKFMESLIGNSNQLKYIPVQVQKVLYEYIKDKAYLPKKYLSSFQVHRIDFNFNGGTKRVTQEQAGMIVAFLLINGIIVQQLLLHLKDVIIEFQHFKNIHITGKFIGSIIHYLTRNTFQIDTPMMKETLALLNYYRNYHIYNSELEQQKDYLSNNIAFQDLDEFSEFLVPEKDITEFWNLNPGFADTYKAHIFAWACKLGRLIKEKYSKSDANLEPKPKTERPPNVTNKNE